MKCDRVAEGGDASFIERHRDRGIFGLDVGQVDGIKPGEGECRLAHATSPRQMAPELQVSWTTTCESWGTIGFK
jgi:hypothetical protein